MDKPKPLMVYDGQCGFCRRGILKWQKLTGNRVDYAPYQEAASQFPEIPKERFVQAVQLSMADGRMLSGAHAVFQTLAIAGKPWPLWIYEHLPGARCLSEWIYQIVSGHRRIHVRASDIKTGKRGEKI